MEPCGIRSTGCMYEVLGMQSSVKLIYITSASGLGLCCFFFNPEYYDSRSVEPVSNPSRDLTECSADSYDIFHSPFHI